MGGEKQIRSLYLLPSTRWTANLASTANQFRALEEDEIMFLDSVRERQEEEERQRKQRDGEEIKSFRESVNNGLSIVI